MHLFGCVILSLLWGQVKDVTTHEPLIGATILVERTEQFVMVRDLTYAWTEGWTSFDPQNEKY